MEGINVGISPYGKWDDLDWAQLPESYLPKQWKTADINGDGVDDILVPSKSKLNTIQNLALDQVEREPNFLYEVEETKEGEVDFDSIELPQEPKRLEDIQFENGDIDFDAWEEMDAPEQTIAESSYEPVSYKVLYGQSDLTSFCTRDPLLHGSIFRLEGSERYRDGNYTVEIDQDTADHVWSNEDGSYEYYFHGLATMSKKGPGNYHIEGVRTYFIRDLELLEAHEDSTVYLMQDSDARQAAL